MRKLVFMLRSNGPQGHNKTPNVEISTHKGARFLVVANQASVLDVTDDEMSDSELLGWYKSRYSGFGMGIKILTDPVPKVESPNQEETKTVIVEPKETEGTPLLEKDDFVSIEKIDKKPIVSEMTYSDMIKFAKDHDIPVAGRAKELYAKAISEWLKKA